MKRPAGVGLAEIIEKKSRFIGVCAPVDSEAAARALLADIRKKHYEARHHCFAYRGQGVERSNDDGEPSGTAGAPILARLRAAGLTDACCIVTRYFGGTLLGTGGLTRAYGAAAGAAIEAAGLLTLEPATRFAVVVDYALEARVRAACGAYAVESVAYTDVVTFAVLVAAGGEAGFIAGVTDAAYGGCLIEDKGIDFIETRE